MPGLPFAEKPIPFENGELKLDGTIRSRRVTGPAQTFHFALLRHTRMRARIDGLPWRLRGGKASAVGNLGNEYPGFGGSRRPVGWPGKISPH